MTATKKYDNRVNMYGQIRSFLVVAFQDFITLNLYSTTYHIIGGTTRTNILPNISKCLSVSEPG